MTADEKLRSPGASCICLSGFEPDVVTNTCRKVSGYSIDNQIDSQMDFLNNLRSMGFDAFPAEGEVVGGSKIRYSCPSNSSLFMNTYCLCDDGYNFDLLSYGSGKVCKFDSPYSNEKYTDTQERRSFHGTDEEWDAYMRSKKKKEEENRQRQLNAYCPTNSVLSEDGSTCFCKEDFELDANGKHCVPSSTMEGAYEYTDQPAPQNSKRSRVKLPSDVSANAWYGEALQTFVERGHIDRDKDFQPQKNATRGEFVQLLVESIGTAPKNSGNTERASFDDVPEKYQDAFEEAAMHGWLRGENDCLGKHPCYAKPSTPINRAAAAALIIRAHVLPQRDNAPPFSDAPDGKWFTDSIRTAASYCILKGYGEKVRPGDFMNRAEMTVMLYRASKNLKYPNCE